jgi:hypothetical protein
LRQWLNKQLDNAFLPMMKLFSPGYRHRLPACRMPGMCDLSFLGAVEPPEGVRILPEPDWQGFASSGYRFKSPYTECCAENRYVYGRLLRAASNAPWVVILPGYGTGAFPQIGYSLFQRVQARGLLEQGLNVALMDPPYHLKRRRKGHASGEGFFSPDLDATQRAIVQGAADTVALIRWLRTQWQRPVGLWATSMSGAIGGLAATQAAEIGALVLMEPLDNPGDVLGVIPGSHEIRSALERHGITIAQLSESLKSVAPSHYQPVIARDRILFIIPTWDQVVPTRFQEAFWHSWGEPRRISIDAGHVRVASNPTLNDAAIHFLGKWLFNEK